MVRRSSIETHPQRELIENAILSGMQATAIAREYGVSESAISRHKNLRMTDDQSVQSVGEGDPTDILRRIVDLADSARRARQIADEAGSPSTKAKAQAVELQILNALATRFGITDLSAVHIAEMGTDVMRAVVRLMAERPEVQADLLAHMRAFPKLIELADELELGAKS
ncbi:hypothetical protein M3D75_02000 [Microbacterium enclense]|uniref:hypothetical protein n=1 Tax=Microbacterium enclense TaxID=993073 RepID=UPI0021A71647|nr:hypothetical protein [Microbacterium enclense]MCT2084883.1 hypothetical protein [Microbacterium enclense]